MPVARAGADDYSLQYIERMPIQTPSSTLGVVPFGVVPAYSSDGEWIYYHSICARFGPDDEGPAFPQCPTIDGVPDYRYHTRRVRIDGTDEECLTCGADASDVNFGRHSGSPEVHGDYMLFSRERYRSNVVDDDYNDTYLDMGITLPMLLCGGNVTAPGGGWYHDLYVMQLSTSTVTTLHTSVANVGEAPGLLDPRWSHNGERVVWGDRQKSGNPVVEPNNKFGDWRIRVASFVAGDGFNGNPHLHGNAGAHGTTPTSYDPGEEGVRLPGGFTLDSSGALSGIYFGGNAETGQRALDSDINALGFSTPTTFVNLSNSSGLGVEPAEYEEHAHLNQKYFDALLWMSSSPYGAPPSSDCFLQDLKTELYIVDTGTWSPTRVSYYNDGTDWLGQNPLDLQTIVSKLQWAPSGVDAVVSVNFITGTNEFDNHLAIYHFKRFQNPTTDAAASGNGFELNPSSAYAEGGGFASNLNGTADIHEFANFDLSIPKTVDPADIVIDGFEVQLKWSTDSAAFNPYLAVRLWDGTAWTAWQATPTGATVLRSDTLGSASDLWGGSWTATDLLNGAFKIQVASYCGSPVSCTNAGRDFNLDWVSVQPTWHVN